MPSLVQGFDYDIFISYRHNDNLDGWVTHFVESLEKELRGTLKESLTIYFDKNPHDGLLETHHVDKSLEGKLKCLIFIPILSQTYCDPKSFAWQHEFCAFNKLAQEDELGRDIKLSNGNVTSRILPIKIHELDAEDTATIEAETGGVLRAIEFVHRSAGVNRSLTLLDDQVRESGKILYRDQVNKVANAIKEIITSIKPSNKSFAEKIESKVVHPTRSIRKLGAIISMVVFAIALTAYFIYPKFTQTTSPVEIEKSIAVLPFENLSDDKEQQYFADGVMEDILTQLQKMSGLRVTSRTSVEQYRDATKSASVIGDELNVGYLLEGSVRKSGNQIMITAQLISTADDKHVWADNFPSEYTMERLFDIQREIAEHIVSKLRLEISPERFREITQLQTDSKEAYEHYIKGRLLYNQRNYSSNERSIEEYKLAIKSDPQFAASYGGLARSFIKRNWNFGFPDSWRDSAAAYANRGIELDDNCVDCYGALAFDVSTNKQEFSKSNLALEYYEKALSINPNDELARSSSIIFYIWKGDYRRAFDYLSLLNENYYKGLELTWLHRFAGNPETFLNYAELTVKLQKDQQSLSMLMGALVDKKDAKRILDVSATVAGMSIDEDLINNGKLLSFWVEGKYEALVKYYEEKKLDTRMPFYHNITYSYNKIGKTEIARQRAQSSLEQLQSSYDNNLENLDRNWQYYNLAFYYLMLDQKDKALESLDRAVNMGWLRGLDGELIFESISDDQRYRALIKKQDQKRKEVMAMYATYHFPEPEDFQVNE